MKGLSKAQLNGLSEFHRVFERENRTQLTLSNKTGDGFIHKGTALALQKAGMIEIINSYSCVVTEKGWGWIEGVNC